MDAKEPRRTAAVRTVVNTRRISVPKVVFRLPLSRLRVHRGRGLVVRMRLQLS